MASVPITIRMPAELIEQTRTAALAEERTVSGVIRHALRLHVEADRSGSDRARPAA